MTVKVGGESRDLELNFYEPQSKLRSPPSGPRDVTIERITRSITFARADDTIATEAQGVLGLDFFRDLNVAIDMTSGREGDAYVWPRRPVTPDKRIARWGLQCPHLGCAEIELHGQHLEVRPDRVPLQLVDHATSPQGAPLPALEITADEGAQPFAVDLDAIYADAQLEVIDASPFPRTCAGATECVVPY